MMKTFLKQTVVFWMCFNLAYPGRALASGSDSAASRWPMSFTQTIQLMLLGIFIEQPLKTVMDKFAKTFLNPRIDVHANRLVAPYMWEVATPGHSNNLRVNDLILNKDTYVKVNTYLLALKDAAMRNDPLPSLMLYGPSGTGKTEIAKRLSNEGPFLLKTFSGTELAMKPGYELKHLFEYANRNRGQTKVVIFIDEVEALLKANAFGVRGGPLTEFLKAYGSQSPYYTFVVATNFMEKIDQAARRRFSNPIYVGLPDPEERTKIYEHYVIALLKHYPQIKLEGNFLKDKAFRKTLGEAAKGLSGSDLKYIAQNNRAEAQLLHKGVITKETVLRHLEEKKSEYRNIEDAFEEAETKRKQDLKLQMMAQKLKNLEDNDDDDDDDDKPAKKGK